PSAGAGAWDSRDRPDPGGRDHSAGHRSVLASLTLVGRFSSVAREPFCVAFAIQRKGIALGGIEIAEQAPDRPVDIEIDIHLFMIDEAFARVQAQHFADKKLAAGPEG